MKHSIKSLLCAVCALSLLAFGGCAKEESAPAPEKAPAAETKAEDNSKSETTVIKVGASPAPHAEILEACKEVLKEKGYDLQIEEFTEWALLNPSLDSGELDANYFQHIPYLEDYCANRDGHLSPLVKVHFEPLGLYKGKSDSLESIKEGAEIGVPNDSTNEARALQLLEAQGIIKLKEDAGLHTTVNDIVENPHNVKIVEMIAAQLPRALQDLDFAVINGNYALESDILDSLLLTEDAQSEAAQEFANVIAVQEGHEDDPAIKALAEAITSDEVKEFIEATYNNTVVPVF